MSARNPRPIRRDLVSAAKKTPSSSRIRTIKQQRTSTYPIPSTGVAKQGMHLRVQKRIVVCCDGTWQDGIAVDERWKYTNVLRLSRAIRHVDTRSDLSVLQVLFYQSGIGSGNSYYDFLVDGATGATLGDKVQEAYAFIAQNFQPGDEIFLFGFSRGAFTARTIASFIGEIGILDRVEMDHFAEIFIALQKRGQLEDGSDEKKALEEKLAPWIGPDAPGKKRACSSHNGFSIKCVGVFDTVGSVGLPEEITRRHANMKALFGFRNNNLGAHIQYAFHALAMNERREDFNCAKFEQTPEGRAKGQILKQCWFSGCHSDIGGGYHEHDLADLTLAWMAANIECLLALDDKYLTTLPNPVAPWGELPPHNSLVGIFELATTIQRKLPSATDDITHETIHPSVFQQKTFDPKLQRYLQENHHLMCSLLPLEEELKINWTVKKRPDTGDAKASSEIRLSEAGKAADAPKKTIVDIAYSDLVKKYQEQARKEWAAGSSIAAFAKALL